MYDCVGTRSAMLGVEKIYIYEAHYGTFVSCLETKDNNWGFKITNIESLPFIALIMR